MKLYASLLGLTLLCLRSAIGAPAPNAPAPKITRYNATFDSPTVLPGAGVLNPVGLYDGLEYNNFYVINPGINPPTGVAAQSYPQFISSGSAVTQLLLGPPGFSVYYTGSTVKSFTLLELYFGCNLNTEEDLTGVAEACTIQVNGYRNGGSKPVATAQFTFIPITALVGASPMQHAVLPITFVLLQNVTIEAIVATGGTTETTVAVDNIIYYTNS